MINIKTDKPQKTAVPAGQSELPCYVGVPVVCQNGHEAVWLIKITGIEPELVGVPEWMKCQCPKFNFGEGYKENGNPVTEARVKYWQQETVESGKWVLTNTMPINAAIDFCRDAERGHIVYT